MRASAKAGAALWDAAAILPSQLLDRHTGSRPAELRLAVAVFEDAMRCLTRNVDRRSGARWQEFVDACDWIWDERRDWPFAFGNVCDLLALDPMAVRRRIEILVARQARKADRLALVKRAAPVRR